MIPSRTQQLHQLLQIDSCAELLLSPLEHFANIRSWLTFKCASCGTPFSTSAFNYVYLNDRQCSYCNNKLSKIPYEFHQRYGNYYEYIIEHTNNILTRFEVICPEHGKVNISGESIDEQYNNHLMGEGCPICLLGANQYTDEQQVNKNKCNAIHNFNYIYEDIITQDERFDVICPKHGSFTTTFTEHVFNKQGCPICDNTNHWVKKFISILKINNIECTTNKTFDNCVSASNRALRFDIYIPEKHTCIEFDGSHHFKPIQYQHHISNISKESYYSIQVENDFTKSVYCEKHGIELIRIPCVDLDDNILNDVLRYITNLPNKRYMYTWNNYEKDVERIINYIKTFNYSKFAIYGVTRGGLPFSVHTSNHFNDSCQHGIITFQRYDGKTKQCIISIRHTDPTIPIFVIDDLISSGITMKNVLDQLTMVFPNVPINPIVIFGEPNPYNITYINPHPKQWIVFPYEI